MNYYSTQPFLAWVLNSYFYGDEHYLYIAPFYPYRLPNPSSSNPYIIYGQLYRAWKDSDEYDPIATSKRLGLRKGAMAKEAADLIASRRAADLKEVCDKVSLRFLCPVVYKVDLDLIPDYRQEVSGSGLRGSLEYLIPDLQPGEFEILLFEYREDPDLQSLFERNIGAGAALALLQSNYASTT